MKSKTIFITAVVWFAMAFSTNASVLDNYYYNYKGQAIAVPSAYEFTQRIQISDNAEKSSCIDLYVSQNKAYILDMGLGTVTVLNEKFERIKKIVEFKTPDGIMETLNKPEGIFVKGDRIYIADSGSFRIIVSDLEGTIQQIIEKPEGLSAFIGEESFIPTKIAVDYGDRMYVIARNINMGILELDKTGKFITFVGAPKVTPSLFDLFWRRFSTQTQLDKMKELVPTEYNNIEIDSEGYLYGTVGAIDAESLKAAITGGSGAVYPIRKLNAIGTDVLKRTGRFAPLGELDVIHPSQITDVALGDYGSYALLDIKNGKIFTYDNEGNLLFAFGEIGNRVEQFSYPVSIGIMNGNLLVLDGKTNELISYGHTSYGDLLFQAVQKNYEGEFEESFNLWQDIINLNPSFEQAYIGIGKSYIQNGNYEEALKYLKLADESKYYSTALEQYRKKVIGDKFAYLFWGLAAFAAIGVVLHLGRKFMNYTEVK